MKPIEGNIILFDGVCNLCNSSVQFILRHDKKKKFHFASLQSDPAKILVPFLSEKKGTPESILLWENGKIYSHSTAALKIARQLRFPISGLYIFMIVPKLVRDAVYKWIARNRYKWFGKKESCMLPTQELKNRFLV